MVYKNSTINWCEENNLHSDYISEWYNTLTGACLSISGIVFYFIHRKNPYISYFNNIVNILIILGIGTMLFHSTLLYIFQLTDEIPMLLLCFEYIKFLDMLNKQHKLNVENDNIDIVVLQKFIYLYSIIISLIGFVYNKLQVVLFQSSILSLVIYLLVYLNFIERYNSNLFKKLLRKKNLLEQQILYHYTVNIKLTLLQNNIKYISSVNNKIQIYKKYFYLCAISSIIVWLIDNTFCPQIKYYNLYFNGHALWHIFSSIGLYYSNKIMITLFKIVNWYKEIN